MRALFLLLRCVPAVLLLAALAAPVHADVITFESVPGIDPTVNGYAMTITTQGFTFTGASHVHIIGAPSGCPAGGCVTNGTYYFGNDDIPFPVVMAPVGGGSFLFSGFDASRLLNDNDAAPNTGMPNADQLCFDAALSGGGVTTMCFALGLPAGFSSHSFGPLSVTSVSFYGVIETGGAGVFALDNIVVSTPEPGTLALFGTGLVALWLRRRTG
jgi:hypothetical protein